MAKWKKGVTGNPNGRPKGTISQSTVIRSLLQSRAEEIIEIVVQRALEGDMVAIKMCLDRICAPLKPKDEFVGFDSFATGLDAAKKCMELMSEGLLLPSEVKTTIQAITQNMKIESMVEEKSNKLFEWPNL